ncbi:type IV pilus assembly protein PilC [Rhodoglobus vestalii]|uniref:Type IV pilus assembly protein PilC n=1 Tax=Rhodoglobus vestalii TaxID=193384 RepID=A0A8H2PYI6_9MICO|nr:type II secretion system F family protein [Rhodoglobus vestalii]TQO20394.1 type IV pilus assembly protein PilC [Rhodoglobus vestalii]
MADVKTFAYTSRNSAGKLVKGKVEAANQPTAMTRLRTMGLSPISIEESAASTGLNREINIPGLTTKNVGLKDLAIMSRQMATMIAAGLSLMKTLTILEGQTENKKLAETLGLVRSDVERGSSFSESLGKHPLIFPRLMIYLVRAGEAGGFLDGALVSVADSLESDVKLRATIKSAMTYPIAVLLMAVAAVIVMLVFIVPIFEDMFDSLGGKLPAPTQFLVIMSANMIWIIPVVLVGTIAFSVWWRANKHTDAVRRVVDPFKLKAPVFGQLFTKVAIARFSRNFSAMIGAGVPILQSLSIVGETSGNWVIEQALVKVQDSVRLGNSIAAPLATEPVFPSMVVQMIAVGEDSGALEVMLTKVADFYDEEVQATAEALTSLIEPLMIAVIGTIIGGMIVALYMPIFTITQQIQ